MALRCRRYPSRDRRYSASPLCGSVSAQRTHNHDRVLITRYRPLIIPARHCSRELCGLFRRNQLLITTHKSLSESREHGNDTQMRSSRFCAPAYAWDGLFE